jgi:hypothetical protein
MFIIILLCIIVEISTYINYSISSELIVGIVRVIIEFQLFEKNQERAKKNLECCWCCYLCITKKQLGGGGMSRKVSI